MLFIKTRTAFELSSVFLPRTRSHWPCRHIR